MDVNSSKKSQIFNLSPNGKLKKKQFIKLCKELNEQDVNTEKYAENIFKGNLKTLIYFE